MKLSAKPRATTSPVSPFAEHDDSLPIILTDEWAMIDHEEIETEISSSMSAHTKRRKGPRACLSRHFLLAQSTAVAPATPPKYLGFANLNVDELSSDSSLTDVPSDIGSDPFSSDHENPGILKSAKVKRPTKSPYFRNKARPNFLSCLPFPPLSAPTFGLMQERLAHDPFRLLIATIFLNRTRGEQAMPVFFDLMGQYPTVADLAVADVQDVVTIIHRLGFQNQRARKCIEIAKAWLKGAPVKGKRYRKFNYPIKGDGRGGPMDEPVDDADEQAAWEISYLPGLGPYSHDSWRIFCRDKLRGLSESWNGEGSVDAFEPEWKRVLPTDKELRAYLTWMWLKEGWEWNKETGQRTMAAKDLLEKARFGGVVQEYQEKDHLVMTSKNDLDFSNSGALEKPAGRFLPR